MDFTLNNGLSMIGGDDFTNIYEEIDTLNDTVVFKAGAQTITGDKTITGDLVVNNENTTITVVGTALSGVLDLVATDPLATGLFGQIRQNADTKIEMRVGGSGGSDIAMFPSNITISAGLGGDVLTEINNITKVDINDTDTTLTNGEIDLVATTGLISMTAADAVLLDGAAGGILLRTNTFTKANITMTNTTLTNDITNIASGANTKVAITSTDTTLTNDTTNIVSGASNKVAISSTATTLNNTNTNIQAGGTTRISVVAGTTTLNNTNTDIQAGGTTRISVVAGTTTLTNDTTNIVSGVNNKIAIGSATTTNTNTTITDVATTRQFQATAGTNVLTISGSNISAAQNISVSKSDAISTASTLTLSNGALSSGLPYLLARKYTSGITTGLTSQYGYTSILMGKIVGGVETTSDLMIWSSNTGDFTLSANGGTTNIGIIQGEVIQLVDETSTTRYTQASGTTTLTNTSINAVGNLYTTAYLLGTSGGSNMRLASMTLPLGTIAIPTGSSSPLTRNGDWSPSGTSELIRTPDWGNFYPLYAMIGFDSGTITGGGTMTIAIRLREETNNYNYTTDAFSLTSATTSAPTAAAGDFTTFTGGSNNRIGGGVLIRPQIVLTRTANITASTKSCYFTAYGYQTR